MMMLAALAALAIVTQDQTALRAAPRDSAQQQAVLTQGDALEIRGQRLDYLQVYDHRRERAGYVLATQVRTMDMEEKEAPELLAVLHLLRDLPGEEALGIAYAAAYLKAAPAQAIDGEPFADITVMAERLADQASTSSGDGRAAARLTAHLEVAQSYGVAFNSIEHDGRMQLCYDGDAAKRVLALKATSEQRAIATLALTRHDCIDPTLSPPLRESVDRWRAEILERVDPTGLPEELKNRIRMRSAGVWASLAFEQQRSGEPSAQAAGHAIDALAAVNTEELSDADRLAYSEAAVRVGASRWATAPVPPPSPGLHVLTEPGEPGQTCVLLVDAHHDAAHALVRRCTFGIVWAASAAPNPLGSRLALAVQPLDTWRELWLFEHVGNTWIVEILPPDSRDPGIGYAEFAGWVPGDRRLLIAREYLGGGRWHRYFDVLRIDTLTATEHVGEPAASGTFTRWQSPAWKRQTIALR